MNNKIQEIFTKYYKGLAEALPLSREMRDAAINIIKCRTPAMDIHFEMCPEHHGFYVLYDSCKHRGCPQCQDIGNQKWLHKKKQVLLPGSYMHYVFKLPVNLALIWLYNKAQAADCLFDSAAKAFRKVRKKDGIERGAMMVFHNNGKGLSYHPHIHCLTTFGGFSADHKWVDKRIDYDSLERVYKEELKNRLVKLVKSTDFINPPEMDCIKEIINGGSKTRKTFDTEAYKTGEGVLAYLAQHMKSGVVSARDILSYNDKEVIIKQGKGKEQEITRIRIDDFILKYLNHIPPEGYRVLRNMGLFSSVKMQEVKAYKNELGMKVEEVDWKSPQHKCPDCGKVVVAVSEEDKKKFEKSCMQYMEVKKGIPVMANSGRDN